MDDEKDNKIKYIQSVNSLIQFMGRYSYLKDDLEKKAFSSRHCVEDTKYLEIPYYEKLRVLQKCFCDIPLNKRIVNVDAYIYNYTFSLCAFNHAG